jgi:hypothetical protein
VAGYCCANDLSAHGAQLATGQWMIGKMLDGFLPLGPYHGHDESYHPAALPDAVLLARRRDDVIDAVRLCHEQMLPIVAYGTRTGLERNVNAVYGGLSTDRRAARHACRA